MTSTRKSCFLTFLTLSTWGRPLLRTSTCHGHEIHITNDLPGWNLKCYYNNHCNWYKTVLLVIYFEETFPLLFSPKMRNSGPPKCQLLWTRTRQDDVSELLFSVWMTGCPHGADSPSPPPACVHLSLTPPCECHNWMAPYRQCAGSKF